MPTRILREGILTSEKVNALSEAAELFYRRLMSVADDYGRYFTHPGLLRSGCYPLQIDVHPEKTVKALLSECVAIGLIGIYNDGKNLQILNFKQQTRSPSKFPQPTDNELLSIATQMRSESESESESESDTKTGAGAIAPGCLLVQDLPAPINTTRMQNKWQVWQTARRALKKPKSWPLLFNEQIEWLAQFDEPTAFEILSASIRNGWQGLFAPKNHGTQTTGNNRGTMPANPRNAYVIKGPTDYAAVFKRKREEAEKASLARQLSEVEHDQPPAANGA